MRRSTLFRAALLAACVGVPAIAALAFPSQCFAQVVSEAEPSLYTARTLTAAQATADVALMRRALETIHPGLYRRASRAQMDAAFAALEDAASRPISELELYRQISQVLATIRCNHTKAEQNPDIEAWRLDHGSHLPFRFRLLQGRMIVESSDPAQSALPRGAEILSINGRSVASLVETLGAYVPIDGETSWARANALSSDGDLMGSDFDHFYPYVFGFADHFSLEVRDSDSAAVRTVTLNPLAFRAWRTLPWEGDRYRTNFGDTTNWRMLDDTTAYLRITTFVNYRTPVDAQTFYAAIFREIAKAGATRLIVDLRDNGGGSSDATYALADFLLQRPFVWNSAVRFQAIRYGDLPDYIETWGDRDETFSPPEDWYTPVSGAGFDLRPPESPEELLPRVPAASAFGGPVTVLTSPVNGSGSTMLIAKLVDEGRVRLVGGRSGGSGDGPTAGQIFNVTLPNSGIAIRVPNAFNAMQVSRFDENGGVTPDIFVEQTVADYRAGRDTVLEAALADHGQPRFTAPFVNPTGVLSGVAGHWTGALEYRDYQSDARVTLPTTLTATMGLGGQSVALAFTYSDGARGTVEGGFTLTLDLAEEILAKKTIEGTDLYRIEHTDADDRDVPLSWTLWGRGVENGVAVDVRETLTVTETTLSWLRETRVPGGSFAFRNAYRLERRGQQ